MPSRRHWLQVVALALAAVACGRGGAPAQDARAPAAEASPQRPVTAADAPAPAEPDAPPEGAPAPVEPAPAAPRAAAGELADPQPGMTRAEFLTATRDCMVRRQFVPGNGAEGTHTVEIFQPREGPCRERYGENMFWLVNNRFDHVRPGEIPSRQPGWRNATGL